MNILILNGSPHVNGNTMAMVNAFADGARLRLRIQKRCIIPLICNMLFR